MKDIDEMSKKELRRLCRAQEVIGRAMKKKIDMLRDRLEEYESDRVMKPVDSGWPPCMDVGDGETLGEKITAFALPAVLVAALIWFVMLIVAMVAAVI